MFLMGYVSRVSKMNQIIKVMKTIQNLIDYNFQTTSQNEEKIISLERYWRGKDNIGDTNIK